MPDITPNLVAELRNFWGMCNNDLVLCAADEIERLTAELAEAKAHLAYGVSTGDECSIEVTELKAERDRLAANLLIIHEQRDNYWQENARLRAALEAAVNDPDGRDCQECAVVKRILLPALAGAAVEMKDAPPT